MGQYEQWDIVTGIGITALGVAAGRAMETSRPDGLVTDPFADGFVAAARPPVPMPTRLPDGDDESAMNLMWTSMSTYLGVRSRFFDRYLAAATSVGIDQVVLLAAGLDTRAFRLDLPADCDLFELDQPKVLQFKDSVLDGQGARSRCHRRTVAVDLRADWPAALRATGFDPARPTAWLAEGLLPYLPAEAEHELFGCIHELSAAGSQLALEDMRSDALSMFDGPEMRQAAEQLGVDISALWHTEDKPDPQDLLTGRGWVVRADPVAEVARAYQRELTGLLARTADFAAFVTARR
jgi:methyltransferase (TIGR00027 family)